MPFYKPKDGYVWSPLRKIPRNSKCPCDSGKKFKHCHLDKISPTIDPHSIPIPKKS